MDNVLEITKLNKKYKTFSLKDISFSIPKGYIMGLVGPNGSGKTTTIKAILNLINYECEKMSLFNETSKEKQVLMNNKIGVVMDYNFYLEDWNMLETAKAISLFYDNWNNEKYLALLKEFSIDENKKIKELSYGMKVKMMIAIAFCHDAEFLILDEPTKGLDPAARDEFCEMLSEYMLNENKTILFSTHITDDLKIADYITFILDGTIIFTGLKDELLNEYKLIKGNKNDLNLEQEKRLIGIRNHENGFEAMIKTKMINIFDQNFLIENITLDEIIIFMNRNTK